MASTEEGFDVAIHRFNDAKAHWRAAVFEQSFLMPEEHLGELLERRESLRGSVTSSV
jgi:hypothetical protein